MKKIFTLALALLLALSVLPCMAAEVEGLTIVATTYPLYDVAKSVVGDKAEVIFMAEYAEETVAAADIVLCIGSEDDVWADELEGVSVVKATNGIELIEGDYDVMTAPLSIMICASFLGDELALVDAANNDAYQANLGEYVVALGELDMHIREVTANGGEIVCNDGSMAYFAREYGLTVVEASETAAVLSTYNFPAEEDLAVSYIELMNRNVAALEAAQAE